MQNIIHISHNSDIPKYKQIVHSIQAAVEQGFLQRGDQLPSFNQIRDQFSVSRDTVIKAYRELKELGVIMTTRGKGNYIAAFPGERLRNIFLLFDEFSPYKEILFNSLKEAIGDNGVLDLYFHHFDEQVFMDLVMQSIGKYTDYVIMPFSTQESLESFSQLFEHENVYILDQGGRLYGETFPSVYQDFEYDIYNGLNQGAELIRGYKSMIMVIDPPANESRRVMTEQMTSAFYRFCNEQGLQGHVVYKIAETPVKPGICFLVHQDKELVELVRRIEADKLKAGHDVGIISFNDTPLKEIAAGGVTTISTDFRAMGQNLGDMILNHEYAHVKNPFRFIKRHTL